MIENLGPNGSKGPRGVVSGHVLQHVGGGLQPVLKHDVDADGVPAILAGHRISRGDVHETSLLSYWLVCGTVGTGADG